MENVGDISSYHLAVLVDVSQNLFSTVSVLLVHLADMLVALQLAARKLIAQRGKQNSCSRFEMRRLEKMSENHQQAPRAVLRTTGDSFRSREARTQVPHGGTDTDCDSGTSCPSGRWDRRDMERRFSAMASELDEQIKRTFVSSLFFVNISFETVAFCRVNNCVSGRA